MENGKLASAWKQHRIWSQVAGDQKNRIARIRAVTRILMVLGGALQTLAAQTQTWLPALLGGVFLVLVPFLTARHLNREKIDIWTRARSASEALKRIIYMVQAGAHPTPEEADTALSKTFDDIQDSVDDLLGLTAKYTADAKPMPKTLDRDAYLTNRITAQINGFYRSRAKELSGRADMLRWGEYALALMAALIGFLVAATNGSGPDQIAGLPDWIKEVATGLGAWVAVITTTAAAITAHIAASRWDEQVTQYLKTALHLRRYVDDLPAEAAPGSDAWSVFVQACEETISSQNREWMAMQSKSSGEEGN